MGGAPPPCKRMSKIIIDSEKLKQVSSKLGSGWFYHSVYSDENVKNYRGHILSNGSGIYINVFEEYKKSICQWALCYRNIRHKTFTRVESVGIDLNRPPHSIAESLKSRLLIHADKTLNKLEDEKEMLLESQRKNENKKLMLEALKMVYDVRDYGNVISLTKEERNICTFNFSYEDELVTLNTKAIKFDLAMKIMNLIASDN